jgi:3-deoxy-D-manno-octulosonic acid kinase
VSDAVRVALASHGTLYAWAAAQPGRDEFQGRGATYGVMLGPVRAVVRHARRGGLARNFSDDRFLNLTPRFRREMRTAETLRAAGIPTPAVLAGVAYPSGIAHTADVATERVDGTDLAAVFFGAKPPSGIARAGIWTAVGKLVHRLHDAGFVHPDLQLKNVLVDRSVGPSVRPSVWLLDVDTVRSIRLRPAAAKHANIKRFFRSWAKHNTAHGERLAADDRSAFLTAYNPALAL